MKKIFSFRKAIELRISLLAVAIVLAACGGGGASSAPTTSTTPFTPTPSTNQVEMALNGGMYILSGFAPDMFISKTEMLMGSRSTVKVFGAVSSPYTDIWWLDYYIPFPDWHRPYFDWTFPANSTQANLSTLVSVTASGVPDFTLDWTFTLNQLDISGQAVPSQIRGVDGTLIVLPLVNPSAIFPPGSIAYTASYTAIRPTVADGFILRENNWNPVSSEAAMYGSGWCWDVAGQTDKLAVEIEANGVVLLYQVPTTNPPSFCSTTGLFPIDIGSWTKEISGADTIYRITYPASITSGVWAPAFANGYSPLRKFPDVITNRAGSTSFMAAHDIPAGSTYSNLQPYFNLAALPALRSAAGF